MKFPNHEHYASCNSSSAGIHVDRNLSNLLQPFRYQKLYLSKDNMQNLVEQMRNNKKSEYQRENERIIELLEILAEK